jgi:cytochrome c
MNKLTKFLMVAAAVWVGANAANAQTKVPDDIQALLSKNTCLACHKVDTKLIGPAYIEVAKRNYTPERIVELIYKPNPANWPGYIPMAALPNVPKDEALAIGKWINSLNKKAAPAKKKKA